MCNDDIFIGTWQFPLKYGVHFRRPAREEPLKSDINLLLRCDGSKLMHGPTSYKYTLVLNVIEFASYNWTLLNCDAAAVMAHLIETNVFTLRCGCSENKQEKKYEPIAFWRK